MLFNSIEFILGISFVFFGIIYSIDHDVKGPFIEEKNCTHVIFRLEVQYREDPKSDGEFFIYRSENERDALFHAAFHPITHVYDGIRPTYYPFFNYSSFRAEPIPDTWRDKHTIYITFRFPNERDEYILAVNGYFDEYLKAVRSPFKVGKTRCLPQNGIIGCDPYCVCDTVVQMQCQNGSLISGKCSDSESLTENSASYTFNEACAESSSETSKPFSSSSGGSKPFSSTESSSGKSPPSQFSKSTIGIIAAAIIGVLAIVAIACYRKKKKGYPSTLSDE